jgi:hypothetical protein
MTEGFVAFNLDKFGYDGNASDFEADIHSFVSHAKTDALVVVAPYKAIGVCFGPFEKKKQALLMASSELDETGKDFLGIRWCITSMEFDPGHILQPSMPPKTIYMCIECRATQRFKGSCATCKSKGKQLIRTIEIRDWEGDL